MCYIICIDAIFWKIFLSETFNSIWILYAILVCRYFHFFIKIMTLVNILWCKAFTVKGIKIPENKKFKISISLCSNWGTKNCRKITFIMECYKCTLNVTLKCASNVLDVISLWFPHYFSSVELKLKLGRPSTLRCESKV